MRYGCMTADISPRLLAIVDALPLRPGMRVLEIGSGPGVMAREMAARIGGGHVLAIDRSAKAVAQLVSGSATEIAAARLSARQCAAEDFELTPKRRIAAALTPAGRLFIDDGDPIREVSLETYRV